MYKSIYDLKCGDLFRIYDKHKYYFVEIPEVRFNSSSVAILIMKDNDYAQIFVNSRMYFLYSYYFNCKFEVL